MFSNATAVNVSAVTGPEGEHEGRHGYDATGESE
jgi:hypothetical protein